jgi:CBS domain-containing protein
MNTNYPTSNPKLVRDLMTLGVATCNPHTSIKVIAKTILEKDLEAIVVLDDEGHALGYVGQEELVRAYSHGNYEHLSAQEIMTDGLPQIPPDIPIAAAAQLMLDQGLRVFFLTHHSGGIEYPAAVLSYKHFLRHLITEDAEEIKDLGIHAERIAPLDAFIDRRDAQKNKNKNLHLE